MQILHITFLFLTLTELINTTTISKNAGSQYNVVEKLIKSQRIYEILEITVDISLKKYYHLKLSM